MQKVHIWYKMIYISGKRLGQVVDVRTMVDATDAANTIDYYSQSDIVHRDPDTDEAYKVVFIEAKRSLESTTPLEIAERVARQVRLTRESGIQPATSHIGR